MAVRSGFHRYGRRDPGELGRGRHSDDWPRAIARSRAKPLAEQLRRMQDLHVLGDLMKAKYIVVRSYRTS
jgi:hypothetical protein